MTTATKELNLKTFIFRVPDVPSLDGGLYHIALMGEGVKTSDPKEGIIQLFNKLGFILDGDGNIDEQIAALVKKQKDSFEKNILLAFFDNPLIKMPAPAPILVPDDEPLDQEGTSDNPPIELATEKEIVTVFEDPKEPKIANVTVNPTPIRPPYRRCGQPNIFDSKIENTINNILDDITLSHYQKSSRSIAKVLENQGIKISHMTVKRRIEEMRKKAKQK
jgi:hypothetical protein